MTLSASARFVAVTAATFGLISSTATTAGQASFAVSTTTSQQSSADARVTALLRQKIKYVFVLYQENRSFDSYFGTFPNAEGLYSQVPREKPGFTQQIINTDGSVSTIEPFRIGPEQYAADTDDIDHSHSLTVKKMDIVDGIPMMDQFAVTEERKYSPTGAPTLAAKQFGELALAHEDCDTIPLLWQYAHRFVLFDNIFEQMTGPSTPGNLSIIAAQSGITQFLLHPDKATKGNGDRGPGLPDVNDADPFWSSPEDKTTVDRQPVNPKDYPGYAVQLNMTYASLPITLQGKTIASVVRQDRDPAGDLGDVGDDVSEIAHHGNTDAVPWGWYEEGYDREPTDDAAGPTDANGMHASYIAHHNGPQYFGYVANNPAMSSHLHGLADLFNALDHRTLPQAGGLYYVKGGYKNIMGLKPADPDPTVQKNFLGDDDHPAYADAQISEAMIADVINRIAKSPYWTDSAIVITWDDSEGDYDHVRPPLRTYVPGENLVSDGPRVPLLVVSPYAKTQAISHELGDQASVVKFVDAIFGLEPLANLPDEQRARAIGLERYGQLDMGPSDAQTEGIGNLFSAFDLDRLSGKRAPLPPSYVEVPQSVLSTLPPQSGLGCKQIGIVPTDVALGIQNVVPADFNPRPKTNPRSLSENAR
jgi:phospholipase C